MPKAEPLTAAALAAPQIVPQAATPARRAPVIVEAPPKVETIPLQIRLPRADVRAIKIAAAQEEQTISDFMLACFHARAKVRGYD